MVFDIKMYSIDRNIIVVKSEGYESILRHSHNFIEMTYVVSGRALHNIGDKTVEIKAGDMFVIATGEEHNIRPVCKESDFKIINILCSHDLFKDTEFPPPNQVFGNPELGYGTQVALIEKEFASETSSEQILYLYVCNLLNCFQIEQLSNNRRKEKGRLSARTIDDYIATAVLYIQENYMNKILLKDIANAVGLYPAYLQKIFRENRSTSVIEYLIRYRMEKSCSYLLETDLTVEEISLMVGVGDLKNFYSVFKKYFNCTPGQYRENHAHRDGQGIRDVPPGAASAGEDA